MKQPDLLQRLSAGVAAAVRSTNFCVSGTLPNISPAVDVKGFGPVKLPLKAATAKRLLAVCQPAPFGKGTRTLVDARVRNSFELSPAKFSLTNPQWDEVIRNCVQSAADDLGLPADQLEPELYKLLLYGPGGFFLPHRDSEKSDGMVGSLIVALPTPFEGGRLVVRHQSASREIDFREAAKGFAPCFAAFYADCEHEVARVNYGFRLCLAYNLVLRPSARKKKPAVAGATDGPANVLSPSIAAWVAKEKAEPLVFALDHHYTQRGLSLDLLKGNDRDTADAIIAAAELAGCATYLCQVSRHILQDANDGRYERSRGYSSSVPKNLELGEIYEDELEGSEWVDIAGKRQQIPTIAFSTASIVASTPLDQWKPTREEYEGYTGNAGNTLDRWYHRSALCVWHRDHHFDVLARADVESAIQMLAPMIVRLKKTPKKRLDDARGECIRLARAIIENWPKRRPYFYQSKPDSKDVFGTFPGLLVAIDDLETAKQLLKCAAPQDPNLDLSKLVVAVCRDCGCAALAGELTALFETKHDEVCVRDLNWLDQLACARHDDPTRNSLIAKLALLAAAQFCQPLPADRYYREDPTHSDQTLPLLVRILLIAGDDETLERVIQLVTSHPERFSVEKTQVPGLNQIIAWCRKQNVAVHRLVTAWLQTLKRDLSAATAHQPQPPADWTRPAEVTCKCQVCRQLNEILGDPQAQTGRIPAREDLRSHLISAIREHNCDVTQKLERTGSPFALVFTKTNGSFERRMKRYAADQELLETVEGLLGR